MRPMPHELPFATLLLRSCVAFDQCIRCEGCRVACLSTCRKLGACALVCATAPLLLCTRGCGPCAAGCSRGCGNCLKNTANCVRSLNCKTLLSLGEKCGAFCDSCLGCFKGGCLRGCTCGSCLKGFLSGCLGLGERCGKCIDGCFGQTCRSCLRCGDCSGKCFKAVGAGLVALLALPFVCCGRGCQASLKSCAACGKACTTGCGRCFSGCGTFCGRCTRDCGDGCGKCAQGFCKNCGSCAKISASIASKAGAGLLALLTLPCIGAFKGVQMLGRGIGTCVACGGKCVADGVMNCGACTTETTNSLGSGCMACVDSFPNIVRCIIAGADEGRPICIAPPEGLRFLGCIGCCLPNPPPGQRSGGCKLFGFLTLFYCCGGSQPRGGTSAVSGGGLGGPLGRSRAEGKRRAPIGPPSAAASPTYDPYAYGAGGSHARSPSQGSSSSGAGGGHMRSPSQGSASGRGGYTPPKASPPAAAPPSLYSGSRSVANVADRSASGGGGRSGMPSAAHGRTGSGIQGRPRLDNANWDAPRRVGPGGPRAGARMSPF